MEKDESIEETRSRAASGPVDGKWEAGPAGPGRPFLCRNKRDTEEQALPRRPACEKAEVSSFPSDKADSKPPSNPRREERPVLTRRGAVQNSTVLNMPDAGPDERGTNTFPALPTVAEEADRKPVTQRVSVTPSDGVVPLPGLPDSCRVDILLRHTERCAETLW